MERPLAATVELVFARPEALDAPGAREAALRSLDDAERARLDRYRFERDRTLYLAAHALLRRALSRRRPEVSPATWRFQGAPGERPELAAPAYGLRFSLSHTHGLVAVAVVEGRSVGVDVERVPEAVPAGVARTALAPREQAALAASAPADAPARFAALWTLKEAYAKALGVGLALEFGQLAFDLGPAPRLLGPRAAGWHFAALEPDGGHRAALCVEVTGDEPLDVRVLWDGG